MSHTKASSQPRVTSPGGQLNQQAMKGLGTISIGPTDVQISNLEISPLTGLISGFMIYDGRAYNLAAYPDYKMIDPTEIFLIEDAGQRQIIQESLSSLQDKVPRRTDPSSLMKEFLCGQLLEATDPLTAGELWQRAILKFGLKREPINETYFAYEDAFSRYWKFYKIRIVSRTAGS